MADPVYSIGGLIEATSIDGQGCLAAVTSGTEDWIIVDKSAAGSEAAAGVGSGTDYPVGVTIDHLLELYWRWKEFRVDWSYAYTYGGTPYSYARYWEFGRTVSPASGTVAVTREAQLIFPAPWVADEDMVDAPDNTLASAIAMNLFTESGASDRVRYYDGLYWPVLGFYLADWNGSDYIYTASTSALGGGVLTTAKITMSDATEYTFDTWQWTLGTVSGTPALEIKAAEYWPHKKANGTPKYSTTTGAKL